MNKYETLRKQLLKLKEEIDTELLNNKLGNLRVFSFIGFNILEEVLRQYTVFLTEKNDENTTH